MKYPFCVNGAALLHLNERCEHLSRRHCL